MSDQDLRPVVVDTSVAVKWHLDEELSDEAAQLLDSMGRTVSELLAPGTIQPEFFNTFWQRYRRRDISLDEVRQGWNDFVSGEPITLYAPEDLMPRAAEITLETGLSSTTPCSWPSRKTLKPRSSPPTANCYEPSKTPLSRASPIPCRIWAD